LNDPYHRKMIFGGRDHARASKCLSGEKLNQVNRM
jgi:hypothetical protein